MRYQLSNQDSEGTNQMACFSFTVDGAPVAKGRPRFARRGSFVTTYTPKNTAAAENQIAKEALQYIPEPITEPVALRIVFYMPIPKSYSKKRSEALKNAPHIKRPDVDNLAKLVLDALNGIAWAGDSQVYSMSVEKRYSDMPRTEIENTA